MGHGGKRAGSGRKEGSPNKATAELKALAQEYGPEALEVLVTLMRSAESEQTRAGAADKILDRGYGKATQPIAGDPEGEPIRTQEVSAIDILESRISSIAARIAKASDNTRLN